MAVTQYQPVVIQGLETFEEDCQGFVIQMREKNTVSPVYEKTTKAVKIGLKWRSEAVSFDSAIEGKTYEYRVATMNTKRFLSAFTAWVFVACSITEPTDITYLGDGIKQSIIWSDVVSNRIKGDDSTYSPIPEDAITYKRKAVIPYYYDHDDEALEFTFSHKLTGNPLGLYAYVKFGIYEFDPDSFPGTLLKEDFTSYNDDTLTPQLFTIQLDIRNLMLSTSSLYVLAIHMKSEDGGFVPTGSVTSSVITALGKAAG